MFVDLYSVMDILKLKWPLAIIIVVEVILIILLILYRLDLIELKTLVTLVVVEMVAGVIGYILGKMSEARQGKLQIIDIIPHENKTGGICELEFQVKNIGGLDLLINCVEFKLLDIYPPNDVKLHILGHLDYSHTYDLDIT